MEYNDKNLKKEFSKIGIGISLMGIGSVYWFIFGYIRDIIRFNQLFVLIGYFLGHFIWLSSPILIYSGLSTMWKRKNEENH